MPTDLERIFAALAAAGARYLVVGGVAVVLHGHLRTTADLDLALALDEDNVRRALSALEGLGYRPRAPVPMAAFIDPAQRAELERTKGLVVFSLWSPELPGTEVDLFASDPLPFEPAWERRLRARIGALSIEVVSLRDLIEMKRRVGRPKDLEDVRLLEALEERSGDEER